MFGLTTTRRLRTEQLKTLGLQTRIGLLQGLLQGNQAVLRRAEQDLSDEIDAHLATIHQARAVEDAHTATATAETGDGR
ncbi:hypothetical protein ACFCY9_12305 [Streptomyces fimicarius]|uniref:hypothetical protein n=1 Tax=Streptomyces griseus TaxID=1911 RepID=UPI0035D870AE